VANVAAGGAASVLALLAYIYVVTVGQFQREADEAADREYSSLERAYSEGGIVRLRQEVVRRAVGQSDMLYVLKDATGQILHQDIVQDPPLRAEESERVELNFTRAGEDGRDEEGQGRGRIGRLLGGPVLLVLSDLGVAARVYRRITDALFLVALIGAGAAIAVGLIASNIATRRAELLSSAAQLVKEGNLGHRLPIRQGGDEFDDLAKNINMMLDELQRLMNMIRTTGDSIAHDLRSPLTRLRHDLEAALEAEPGSTTERAALRKAVDEADKLLNTFHAVLKVSRIESFANWRFDWMDVSAIVSELVEFYEPVADEADLQLTNFVTPGLKLRGEPQLITQALSNLIENAVKYTPPGGRVEIRASFRADGRLEIAVLDNGPGVPKEDRDRVAQRFVRLESSRSTPGSGLGLSLVEAVARLHKGVLSLGDGLGAEACPGLRAALVLPAAQ
jgi:signal transduction histidine kinase